MLAGMCGGVCIRQRLTNEMGGLYNWGAIFELLRAYHGVKLVNTEYT